jgi:protein-tyrosine-phosphatase
MPSPAQLAALTKTSVKKIIPDALLKERDIIVRLGPGSGRIYARMRLLETIGMNAMSKRLVPPNVRSFVFVCFGNIMRSPMASALLEQAAAEKNLRIRSDSAGLHAIAGSHAHERAQTAAAEMGIPLTAHRSKMLTKEMIEHADAILAMDLQNVAELLNLYPQFQRKIFMLSACSGSLKLSEIPDPYFGDLETTRQCYRVVDACVRNMLASLTT